MVLWGRWKDILILDSKVNPNGTSSISKAPLKGSEMLPTHKIKSFTCSILKALLEGSRTFPYWPVIVFKHNRDIESGMESPCTTSPHSRELAITNMGSIPTILEVLKFNGR